MCGYVILGLTGLMGVLTHSLVSIEEGNPVKVSLGPMQERIKPASCLISKLFSNNCTCLAFQVSFVVFPTFPWQVNCSGIYRA